MRAAMMVASRGIRRGRHSLVGAACAVGDTAARHVGGLVRRITVVVRGGRCVGQRTHQQLEEHQDRGKQRRFGPTDHAAHHSAGLCGRHW